MDLALSGLRPQRTAKDMRREMLADRGARGRNESARPHQPSSMRERTREGVAGLAGMLGMDERRAHSLGRGIAGTPVYGTGRAGLADMLGAGSLMAIEEGRQQFNAGEELQGAMNVGLGALDVVPGAAEALTGLGKMAAPMGAIFAGIGARNAPLDQLVKAEAMEKAGDAADDIWRATGWGRGADGEWRWEIDDSGAVFTGSGRTIGEALDHPKLYEAYPDIRNAPFSRSVMDPGTTGYYDPSTGGIGVAKGSSDGRKTALHEAGHAVDAKEGWDQPSQWRSEKELTTPLRGLTARRFRQAHELRSEAQQAGVSPQRWIELRQQWALDKEPWPFEAEQGKPFDPKALELAVNDEQFEVLRRRSSFDPPFHETRYWRQEDEVRQRAVERRADLTEEERANRSPRQDEDVPRDRQLVVPSMGGREPSGGWPFAMAAGSGSRAGREAMEEGGSLAQRLRDFKAERGIPLAEPLRPLAPEVRPGVNARRLDVPLDFDPNRTAQVYRNPSKAMVAQLHGRIGDLKTYRDPDTGDVYVWEAQSPLLHGALADQLGIRRDHRAAGYLSRQQSSGDGSRAGREAMEAATDSVDFRRGSTYTPSVPGMPDATPGAAFFSRLGGGDGSGALPVDAEGRQLRGRYVVGRHGEAAGERSLHRDEAKAVVLGLTGNDWQLVPRGQIRHRADGSFNPAEGVVRVADDLDEEFIPRTLRHELGHVLDRAVGMMDDSGIVREMDTLYKEGSTRRGTRGSYTPADAGYFDREVRGERVAEALRIYMEHPEYIKTVAPKTAARIRKLFNENPRVAEWIQFNGIAGLLAVGGSALALGAASQPAEARE